MNYLYAIITAVIVSLSAYGLHTLSVKHLEAEQLRAISALTAQCNAQKAITEKVSNDYQKNLSVLNAKLADAERVYGGSCITILPNGSGRYDAAPGQKKPAGQSVGRIAAEGGTIEAGRFFTLIGEGEKYRLQLLACQSFVRASASPQPRK